MNEVATAVSKGAIVAAIGLAKDLVGFLASRGHKELTRLSVSLEFGFKQFLDRNYKKHSKIKTLLRPTSPTSLELAYEPAHLQLGDSDLDEDGVLSLLESDHFMVITGLGGSGKSIFLRHLYIRYYNEGRGRIPFLVELRNKPGNQPLFDYMLDLIRMISNRFDNELFDYALNLGKFAFLLDGFDEIDYSQRTQLAHEIIELTYRYDENIFVVTSRPDSAFSGWQEFNHAEMKGLEKNQVISLISKIKYDNAVKKPFLKLIKAGTLFESHGSYLSNPLLCNIMLLTFGYGANIPDKMHLFFAQTFDVLFYRHDSTKGTNFRRKFRTSLPIDEFRCALSGFSAFSYIDFGPTLNHESALICSKKGLQYFQFEEEPDAFLHDLCSSVSILIEEGGDYSYIHRTLQEYFVAIFLSQRNIKGWGDVVETIVREKPNDSVPLLLRDINREKFESEFLAPRIKKIVSDLSSIDVRTNPSRAFKLFYLDISVSSHDSNGINSWTVGSGSNYPKWYYMGRFLREGDSMKLLKEFDWRSHLLTLNPKTVIEHPMEVNLGEDNVRDESFLGTPMVEYLESLKKNAVELNDRFSADAATRKTLVADTLFRKDRGKGYIE